MGPGGNMMMNNPNNMGPPTVMMNIGKPRNVDPMSEKITVDDQKSLAQITRAFFGRLR